MLTIDARGEKCPLPVLRAEKAIARVAPGGQLVVLATDPVARIDIPYYCQTHGHDCVVSAQEGVLRFQITRDGVAGSEAGPGPG